MSTSEKKKVKHRKNLFKNELRLDGRRVGDCKLFKVPLQVTQNWQLV